MKRFWVVLMLLALISLPRPLSASEPEEEGISTGRYVTSGVIGTVIGLGIGHGVQGRYLPLGLVFTLTEALGYVAFFADSTLGYDIYGLRTRHVGTIGALGIIVASGFHIWEIVDVWVAGNRLHQKFQEASRTEFMLPVASVNGVVSPGLSVGWRF